MDTNRRHRLLAWFFVAVTCSLAPVANAAPPSISNRVINGTPALSAEFPFMTSLRNRMGSHTCGASIIHAEWVMTAAHCIFSSNPEDFSVQYGTNEISQSGRYVTHVKRVIMHQGYDDKESFLHDIALLQLTEPIEFNVPNVQPVVLPDYMEFTESGAVAQLIGWGFNDTTSGMLQTKLQKVELLTVTDDVCRNYHWDKVHRTNICAGVEEGGRGQCTGDSGGPLIVDNKQVGIVSWSVKPCTMMGFPGVSTEVTYYVGWLREHTGVASLGRNKSS